MKIITIGGLPGAGKTYTSKLLAEQHNLLALEFESLRWDYFNQDLKNNLYKYTQNTSFIKNENIREYYLRCALYEKKIPLQLLVKWHKETMKFINKELYKIISELKLIKTEGEYINFCNKYKKLINHMPQFKTLNSNYVIFSHAFINTVDFLNNERIKINLSSNKETLIKRFKQREHIIDDTYDENIELYYKSYEEVLKKCLATKLDTEDINVIGEICDLIYNV